MKRQHITHTDALKPGQTLKFNYEQDGIPREGFLARLDADQWVAYENRCRHIPITLDFDNNLFFTSDGRYFFCQSHGAVYQPDTGLCIEGPCTGAKLFRLPLIMDDDGVFLDLT